MSVADDSGAWECLALEHNSMHQLNIAGVAVGAAHNMASRFNIYSLKLTSVCFMLHMLFFLITSRWYNSD